MKSRLLWKDPRLIDVPTQRIPDEWRRQYLQRPIEKLPADVTKLYDENYALRREINTINRRRADDRRDERLKRWFVTAILVVAAELIKILLPLALHAR